MDNLRAHKVPGVREAIETARATVSYLPKYSPDLTPIEMPDSKFKALLRQFAVRRASPAGFAWPSLVLQVELAGTRYNAKIGIAVTIPIPPSCCGR